MVHGVNKFFDNIEASAERYNIPHEIFRSAEALRSRFPQFAVNGTEVGFLDKGGAQFRRGTVVVVYRRMLRRLVSLAARRLITEGGERPSALLVFEQS
jgi:hypothetical protein